jgi:hypothetical protein
MDRRMRGSFRMSRCLQRLPAPFSVALSETCAETRTPWNCRKRVLSPDLPHTRKFATDTRATAYWGAEFRIPCNVASLLNFAENWQFETHTDAGVENVNADVDDLIAAGVLRRVLAFTELKFSNSMIEAWWRAQAPLALSPLTGQRHDRPTAGRLLCPGTQPGASPFGVSRTDAGRNVFRYRGCGSSRPDGTRGRRTAAPPGGKPIGGMRDMPINRGGRIIARSRRLRAAGRASRGDCPEQRGSPQ